MITEVVGLWRLPSTSYRRPRKAVQTLCCSNRTLPCEDSLEIGNLSSSNWHPWMGEVRCDHLRLQRQLRPVRSRPIMWDSGGVRCLQAHLRNPSTKVGPIKCFEMLYPAPRNVDRLVQRHNEVKTLTEVTLSAPSDSTYSYIPARVSTGVKIYIAWKNLLPHKFLLEL
jgi:hypothetical protein